MRSSYGALIALHISQRMARLPCAAEFFVFITLSSPLTTHHTSSKAPMLPCIRGVLCVRLCSCLACCMYLCSTHLFIVSTAITLPAHGVDVSTWLRAVLFILLMLLFCLLFLRTARVCRLHFFFAVPFMGRQAGGAGGKRRERKKRAMLVACVSAHTR